MSFSENLARLVSDQLARFITLNPHQLAGHVSNLDFWIDQAESALRVIDGYQERFRRLKNAQADYVTTHRTIISSPIDPDIKEPPAPPSRVPDAALRDARRSVVDATYGFLLRCFREGLIPESRFRSVCKRLDIGIDPGDLKRAVT